MPWISYSYSLPEIKLNPYIVSINNWELREVRWPLGCTSLTSIANQLSQALKIKTILNTYKNNNN